VKELVSIIVPVYNCEKYLEECITSLINQDYPNIEIILVNDGSKDNSGQICDYYAGKDNRVRVIHKKNEGVSSARNRGIAEAKGTWLTFVDADDWVTTDYVSQLSSNIDDQTDFIIGRTIGIRNDEKLPDGYKGLEIEVFNLDRKEELFKSIFNDNIKLMKFPHISTCSAKLIRVSVIKNYAISYNKYLKYYEDALFNMELISRANQVKMIDKEIYMYRLHSSSSTKKFDLNTIKNYELVYEIFRESQFSGIYKQYEDVFKIKNLHTILLNYYKSKGQGSITFINEICSSDTYRNSIKNVKVKLLPKRRKLLVIFGRLKMYHAIYLLYKG
jgi:glycosyltransferase involved in cell wall biosynthesis